MRIAAALALLAALSASALAAAPAAASRPGGAAGRFDTYVFSLEWTPAFCEGKGSLPECSGLDPSSFAANDLALHGLWPDKNDDPSHSYAYCGVDPKVVALDRAPTWCRMPAPGLSDATLSRLSAVMPGVASCLQNHEWYKHGVCSGLSPDDYFDQAAALVEQVSRTAFGRFLTANVGRVVQADDLLAAFEQDFGAGTRDSLTLSCTPGPSGSMLLDARVHLTAPLQPGAPLAGQLSRGGGGGGTCGPSFLIDPVR